MKHRFYYNTLYIVFVLIFSECQQGVDSDLVKPSSTKNQKMAWWKEARFGMFMHWGIHPVNSNFYNDNSSTLFSDDVEKSIIEHDDNALKFNPSYFSPHEVVGYAKDAGMKYLVMTAKHHDGFCFWESEYTEYDIIDATPYTTALYKGDILREMEKACNELSINFGVYYSITDWHHQYAGPELIYNNNQQVEHLAVNPNFDKYIEEYLKPQLEELIEKYPSIKILWLDGESTLGYTPKIGADLKKMISELNPEILVNIRASKEKSYKIEGDFSGMFGLPDQKTIDLWNNKILWESTLSINDTWGYDETDNNWKTGPELIKYLINTASQGGNLMLNIGPDNLGIVPESVDKSLYWVGSWMNKNGEAIYGTSESALAVPDWGRYTQKENKTYAHVFEWPENNVLLTLPDTLQLEKAYFLHQGSTAELPSKKADGFWQVTLDTAVKRFRLPVVVLENKNEDG